MATVTQVESATDLWTSHPISGEELRHLDPRRL